ncbi:hemin uptake protein HemP [Phreatobacter stygius]|uniref:Hemin uptake protein HemP n=1 Tax=Phreatobacter stygius TaxID=1940610 RepID=A0A4D7BJC9_9HYPH|nr:hemin uptake protein HemP [Phreatobacter stygius]QCI67882.1 hemin uptake protein HemP [Phreatobacter stygius]
MISGLPRPPHGNQPDASLSASSDAIPTVELTAILGTGREAVILHKGERYRLRVTANDKLILTK